jgi:ABC-type transporter MlaC component
MFNAFKKKLTNQFPQLLVEHDDQSNKIKHNANIKENTHNSIYINIYNKKIQDVPIIPCFSCERLYFLK